ncbi:unnamed protein product [Mortierella alpina]
MTIVEQDTNMDLEPSAVIQESAPVTMPSQTSDAPDQPAPPQTSNGAKSRIDDEASSTPASDHTAATAQPKSLAPSIASEVSGPHKDNVTSSATGVGSPNKVSEASTTNLGAREGRQHQAVQSKTDSAEPASLIAEFEDGPDSAYLPRHHYASAIFRPQIDDIILDEDLLEFYERLKFLISLSPLKTAQVLYAFSYATDHLSLELEVRRSVLDMNRKAFSFFQDNTWFMVDLEPEADPSEDEAYESSDPKFKILPARHSLFPAFQNQSRRQETPGYASHPYYYHEQAYGHPYDNRPYMPPPRPSYYGEPATASGPSAAVAPLQQEDDSWGYQDDYQYMDHERHGKSSEYDSRPSKRRHSREAAHGSSRSSLHESKKIRQDPDAATPSRSRHNQEASGKLSSLEPTSPHQSSSAQHGSEKHREKHRERDHDPEREIARLERRLARKMLKYPGKYRHRAEDLVASSEARAKDGATAENPARGRTLKVTLVQSSKPPSSSLTQPSSAEGSNFDRPKPLHGWIPPADQIEGAGSAPSSTSTVHRSIRPSDPDASSGADGSAGVSTAPGASSAPGAAAGQSSAPPHTSRKSKQPLQAAPAHGSSQGAAQDNSALYTDKSEEKLKKGTWTAAEEEILLEAVRDLTSENWHAVAMKVPGRNAKQCMQKWQTDLDPQINRLPWTAAEDEKLVEAYHTFGNAWQQIAKMVETRTWYQCYNRVRAKSVKTKIMETVGTHPASIAAGRAGMAGGLAGQRSGSVGAASGSSSGANNDPRRGSKDSQPLQPSTQTPQPQQAQQTPQPQQSQQPQQQPQQLQQVQQAQQVQQMQQPKTLTQSLPPQQPQQRVSQPSLVATNVESRQAAGSQTPTSYAAGPSAEKAIHLANEASGARGAYNGPNPGRSPELSYVGYKPGPTSQMLTHHTQQQTQSPQQPPPQSPQSHQQPQQPHQQQQQPHQQSQQPQQPHQPSRQHLAHQAPPQHPQPQQQHGVSWSKQAPSPVNQASATPVDYHSPKHPAQQQQLSQQTLQHRTQISSAQSQPQPHSPSLSSQQRSHQPQMHSPGPSGNTNVNSGAGLGIQGANSHGYNAQQSPHSKQQQGSHYRQLSSNSKPMPHTPPPVPRQAQGQPAMGSSSTQPSPVAPTQASSPSAQSTTMMHHHQPQPPHSSQPSTHPQYPQGHRPPMGQKSHSYSPGSVQHMSANVKPQGSQAQTQSQYQSQHQQGAQFSPSNNVYANGHQKMSSYSGSPITPAPASSPSSQTGAPSQHPQQVSFQHQQQLQQGGHSQAFSTPPPTGSGALKMVSGGGTPVPSISTFAAPPLAPPLLSPTIASSPTGFISTSALLMMARNAQASTASPSSPASNPNSPSSGPGQIPSSSIPAPPGGGGSMN